MSVRPNKPLLILAAFLLAAFLVSCRAAHEMTDALGIGEREYGGEAVVGTVPLDGEIADEIRSMIKMLSVDSVKLPKFDNMKDAVTKCHDSLLNYMLYTDYAKYAGNPDLLEDAEREYPDLGVSQIIPASEFESMMYRYFGGNVKISHGDSRAFKYLSRIAAYIPVGRPISDAYDVNLLSIDETEHTYRTSFECSNGKMTLRYDAVIVKRDDGTFYFSSVS